MSEVQAFSVLEGQIIVEIIVDAVSIKLDSDRHPIMYNQIIGEYLTPARQKTFWEQADKIVFVTSNGNTYSMYHDQDCCESVYLADIDGSFVDILNSPVLKAYEESMSGDDKEDIDEAVNEIMTPQMRMNNLIHNKPISQNLYEISSKSSSSSTWSFYCLYTNHGYLWLRWLGMSNGYYSERVDFIKEH